MGVGRPDCYLLGLFGDQVRHGFGHTPYHVGSSMTQKRGWRDVDVRLILPDDEYREFFGEPLTTDHDWARLRAWELAWSMLGRQMTGLPIDFQIQSQTHANAQFSEPRSALFSQPAL